MITASFAHRSRTTCRGLCALYHPRC